MHWIDVLCKHWDALSEERQEQMRQYDLWCLIAEQHGQSTVPELARHFEESLLREAQKFGWKPEGDNGWRE